MSDRLIRLPNVDILQRGAALQITAATLGGPLVLEFTGESLAALLTVAQSAFRERAKPGHYAECGRATAAVKKGWWT